MRLSLSLAPDASAPSRARTSIRALSLGLDAHVLRDVQLVVSELVSNAVEHGPRQGIRVDLQLVGRNHVRGEIVDQGAAGSAEEFPRDDNHLGLRIVERLTSSWGVRAGSTHVWFELKPA